jgi:hypothetical protein
MAYNRWNKAWGTSWGNSWGTSGGSSGVVTANQLDATTANDALTILTTFRPSQNEATNATDTLSVLSSLGISVVESVSANDSSIASNVLLASLLETVSLTDIISTAAGEILAHTENTTANDLLSIAIATAHQESTTTSDTRSALAIYRSSVLESASATDTLLTSIRVPVMEQTTASDNSFVILAWIATQQESAAANDIILATRSLGISQLETTSAADAYSVALRTPIVEAVVANDTIAVNTISRSSVVENLALDSIQGVISTQLITSVEATVAVDHLSSIGTLLSSSAELFSLEDILVAPITRVAVMAELGAANDQHERTITAYREADEAVNANDSITETAINRTGVQEPALAISIQDGDRSFPVAHIEYTKYAIIGPSAEEIAAEIWDRDLDIHNDAGSAAMLMKQLYSNMDVMLDVQLGNWEIKDNQMIFYSISGESILTYNLSDGTGKPSMTEVLKRELVAV